MLKLLIFDLDDTLFKEEQYVMSGYRAVAKYLSEHASLSSEEIYERLRHGFLTNGRSGAMDRLVEEFSIRGVPTSRLVRIYRRHSPGISLQREVVEVLHQLKQRYKLALLTNGWVQVQKRKVKALGVEHIFDLIVYAQERGLRYRKPHGRFFRRALRYFAVTPQEALMIGDDPIADGQGAHAVGIEFYRVESLEDLVRLVDKLGPFEPVEDHKL